MSGDGWYMLAAFVLAGLLFLAVALMWSPVAIVLLATFFVHQITTYED